MGENAQPEKKKGLSGIAWVLIGCVSLMAIAGAAVLVVGFFVANKVKEVAAEFEGNPAMAAAEMIVKFNPELELVQKDVDAQTLTVRNTRTGEVVTVDVNQIREGKISFENEDGRASFEIDPGGKGATVSTPKGSTTIGGGGDLLSWVPRYPGAEYQQVQRSTIPQGLITMFSVRSDDSAEEVLEFYRRHYEEQGYEVTMAEVNGAESTLFAVSPDKSVKMNIGMADLDAAGSAGMLRTNDQRKALNKIVPQPGAQAPG